MFTSSRGFTEEEERYFAAMANKSYESFVAKAAASRSMTCEEMEEVCRALTISRARSVIAPITWPCSL